MAKAVRLGDTMPAPDNKYTQMQKEQYESNAPLMNQTGNHRHHDANPDYWNVLLGDVVKDPDRWEGKWAYDFGCGQGRNIVNLFRKAKFARVDGGDIAKGNLKYAAKNIKREWGTSSNTELFLLNGTDLQPTPSDKYDLVMSTIVLQHIPVYDIRFGLLSEMRRILKTGGLLTIQMGYDKTVNPRYSDYYANNYDADRTNGFADVSVTHSDQIKGDLSKIGFRDIKYQVRNAFDDSHSNWIYISGVKC
jgi:ubiquinone/menaquinone biosynthesis C-methylase UbiE